MNDTNPLPSIVECLANLAYGELHREACLVIDATADLKAHGLSEAEISQQLSDFIAQQKACFIEGYMFESGATRADAEEAWDLRVSSA